MKIIEDEEINSWNKKNEGDDKILRETYQTEGNIKNWGKHKRLRET